MGDPPLRSRSVVSLRSQAISAPTMGGTNLKAIASIFRLRLINFKISKSLKSFPQLGQTEFGSHRDWSLGLCFLWPIQFGGRMQSAGIKRSPKDPVSWSGGPTTHELLAPYQKKESSGLPALLSMLM